MSGVSAKYDFECFGEMSSIDGGFNVLGRTDRSTVPAISLIQYTGTVGDEAQEDDDNNYDLLAVINNEKADFTTMPVKFANMDTTTRDALTAEAGMVIFNTTDTKLQVYTGSAWVDLH